jgi:uncharacterized protein YbcV (DUF1398 family)
MTEEQANVMRECVTLSYEGKITFGEVVGRLMKIGVERYHADYSRTEKTYYMPDGESLVVPTNHPPLPVAEAFSAEGVGAAIREIQRGQIDYKEFVRKTCNAGCVGYFVQIAGRQALYFGRKGEVFVEPFPSPKK